MAPQSSPKAPQTTESMRGLAKILGVKVQQIGKESKRSGFPSVRVKGQKRFVVEDVRRWRASNINSRKAPSVQPQDVPRVHATEPGGAPAPVAPIPPGAGLDLFDRSLATEDDPFIRVLMGGDSTPLAIADAAMQMAARRVGKGSVSGELSTNDLAGLTKSITEVRGAKESHIELAKSQRMLIDRTEVESIVGTCCARLVRCLSTVENSIATEFALWLADEKVRAMGTDERARVVREFVAKTCHQVRAQESQDVRKLIDTKRDEDESD